MICKVDMMKVAQDMILRHLIAMSTKTSKDIIDDVEVIECNFVASSMFETKLFDFTCVIEKEECVKHKQHKQKQITVNSQQKLYVVARAKGIQVQGDFFTSRYT